MSIDTQTKEVLDARLVKGEITRDEYEKIIETMSEVNLSSIPQTAPSSMPSSAAKSTPVPVKVHQQNDGVSTTLKLLGIVPFIAFVSYILFFWSFVIEDGTFSIYHKRKPSLENIFVQPESSKNLLGLLVNNYAIQRYYCGVILSVGDDGVEVLNFW